MLDDIDNLREPVVGLGVITRRRDSHTRNAECGEQSGLAG